MYLMEGTAQVRQVVGQLGGWVLSTQGLLSPNQDPSTMNITTQINTGRKLHDSSPMATLYLQLPAL